jgi:hypothetical protein
LRGIYRPSYNASGCSYEGFSYLLLGFRYILLGLLELWLRGCDRRFGRSGCDNDGAIDEV